MATLNNPGFRMNEWEINKIRIKNEVQRWFMQSRISVSTGQRPIGLFTGLPHPSLRLITPQPRCSPSPPWRCRKNVLYLGASFNELQTTFVYLQRSSKAFILEKTLLRLLITLFVELCEFPADKQQPDNDCLLSGGRKK